MTVPRGVRRWLPLFAAAVAVRLLYWALVTPHWRPASDALQYVLLSRALADGRGFGMVFPQLGMHPTAFRPPLYPALLTPGAWLFGEALWPARLLNVLIGSLVAVLAGVFAARVAGRRAGWAAAGIVALYPPLIANDTVTLTEPLALALILGALLLLDDERWVPAGLLVGALLLTRPNGYLVLLVVAVWAWRRAGVKRAAVVVACALALFVPWLVRNRIQVHTWSPTTSDGFTMAAMWAAPAQRHKTFVDPVLSPDYGDLRHRLLQFDEAAWNAELEREALRGIRANPGYIWHLLGGNSRAYFELQPSGNRLAETWDGRNWRFRQALLPLFFVVTLAGLAGLATRLRDARVVVLLVIVAQFVALSLVLVAPPRLRAPFDLAMCIGAGMLVASVLERRSDRQDGPSQRVEQVPVA